MYVFESTGTQVLLIADQVLWFGNDIPTTLINPNQLRAYGVSVCDDPWDPFRPIGVQTDFGLIPFQTAGTTLSFVSYSPSQFELDNLPIIELTGPHWNPHELSIPKQTLDEHSVSRSRLDTRLCANPYETDSVLGKISPHFNTDIALSLYESAVQVTPVLGTTTGACRHERIVAAITGTKHTNVTPESLARLWNVGIETAKATLRVTTQQGIRTALHPLH